MGASDMTPDVGKKYAISQGQFSGASSVMLEWCQQKKCARLSLEHPPLARAHRTTAGITSRELLLRGHRDNQKVILLLFSIKG